MQKNISRPSYSVILNTYEKYSSLDPPRYSGLGSSSSCFIQTFYSINHISHFIPASYLPTTSVYYVIHLVCIGMQDFNELRQGVFLFVKLRQKYLNFRGRLAGDK